MFHNRRWDTDVRTLRGVLDDVLLGNVWRFDSRFDLDQPATLEAGPGGGLLRDLGSHLVDQALWLLGPARLVSANLDWVDLPEGRTDAGFVITLSHASGAHSHLSSSKLNRLVSRELRLFGSLGSSSHRRPTCKPRPSSPDCAPSTIPRLGLRVRNVGALYRPPKGPVACRLPRARTPTTTPFRRRVAGTGPQPVPAAEAVATLAVLDAARISDAEGTTVRV